MAIKLEKNGVVKEVKTGFSWTTFFFGLWVPVIRGDLKWAAIMLIVAMFTFGLSWLVFPFLYNKIYIKELLANGWNPVAESDRTELIGNNIISG